MRNPANSAGLANQSDPLPYFFLLLAKNVDQFSTRMHELRPAMREPPLLTRVCVGHGHSCCPESSRVAVVMMIPVREDGNSSMGKRGKSMLCNNRSWFIRFSA